MEQVNPIAAITKMDPEDLAELMGANGDGSGGSGKYFVVIDVRGDDYVGGHIKGSVNIPSQRFIEDSRAIDELIMSHNNGKERTTFVFHCMESQVRGPTCASKFAARLAGTKLPEGMAQPVVNVLRGGYHGWKIRYAEDENLTSYDEKK